MEKLITPQTLWERFESSEKLEIVEDLERAMNYQRTRESVEKVKLLLEFERDGLLLRGCEDARLSVPGLQRAADIITELLERKDDAPDR